MLLSVSGQVSGDDVDLSLVTGHALGDGGVVHGQSLVAFAEAVMGDDDGVLANRREQLVEEIGGEGLVDAAAVIAIFNSIDRIADATGISLDEMLDSMSGGIRSELGIDNFKKAKSEESKSQG